MSTTLRNLFTGALERFGERVAVVCEDRQITYAELAGQANQLAHALNEFGVGPGDAVALLMENCVEYLVADQAIIRLGAAKVPLNSMLSPEEIAFIVADSGASVLIADGTLLQVAYQDGPRPIPHVIAVDHDDVRRQPGAVTNWSWPDLLAHGYPASTPPALAPSPEHTAVIAYTGGTTGRPKGVLHTQRAIYTNLLAHLVEIGFSDDEALLLTTPLTHASGPLAQSGLLKGARIVVEKRFDPERTLDRIATDQITFTFAVPTMIYRLLDRMNSRTVDVSSLRTVLYGAAPITRSRLKEAVNKLGPVLMQLYGQTEAPNFICRLSREDHDPARPELLGSCGQASLLMDVAILDEDDTPVPPGQSGEVCARGPYVMAGYHKLADKTASALRNGWLHTGDIGYLDEQRYLFLLDRKNDVIITGGMNVYSAEVENVLQTVPGVKQIAVVGLPDDDWGEAVTAFLVADIDFDRESAAQQVRTRLAAYKRPKHYIVADALPTTSLGKIDKQALRSMAKLTSPLLLKDAELE